MQKKLEEEAKMRVPRGGFVFVVVAFWSGAFLVGSAFCLVNDGLRSFWVLFGESIYRVSRGLDCLILGFSSKGFLVHHLRSSFVC